MKRLETAIADLKGIAPIINSIDGSPFIFSCHKDIDVTTFLKSTTTPYPTKQDELVAELRESSLLGLHHFVQVAKPPANVRFDGWCFNEQAADSNDHAGCSPFDQSIGTNFRVVRSCMQKVLATDPKLQTIIDNEWSHADENGKLPDRESGGKSGTKSAMRGTWTKETFTTTLPNFIITRLVVRMSCICN